ncbi:hypothetical protein [Sorangium sp. So ce388]|uniref:hypothetical protein n=1 Tax=Sorangium sp. So ce388 TaxID=3133309 RepID=UPI003F5B28EF
MTPIIPSLAAHPILAASAQRAQARKEAIARLAVVVGDRGEAQRAVELAERVGAGLDALEWLAARGEPLPQDEDAMREAWKQKRARDVFAMLGVAFPWG